MPEHIIGPELVSKFDPLKELSVLQRNAIVRPNNPPPGLGGFLFSIPKNERVELTSDITDYYVEGNSAISDNIALRPEIVTVSGLIAELTYRIPKSTAPVAIPDALPNNPELEPEFTPEVQQRIDEEEEADSGAEIAATDSGTLADYYAAAAQTDPTETKQSAAFLYFQNLWMARQLFSVETPWGIWTSMAISSIVAEQEEDTQFISNFRVTFKRFRVVDDITIRPGQLAGRAVAQQAEPQQNGSNNQTPITAEKRTSLLKRLIDLTK